MTKLPQADKKLGQHFLTSEKVINAICSDFAEEADIIVEVGPGPAVLTQHLSKLGKPLYVIEKDQRFKETLEKYVDPKNIYMQDALKFSWNKFSRVNKLENKKVWLVSNLPYNVGTVLFTQFLEVPFIQFMTLMFQKEVGQKTYLRDVKNQMNGLLFLSTNYFNSKQLIKVPPGCFSPPPKVDSVVVSYERKETPQISIEEFKNLNSFLRLSFGMKRKQLFKVLKARYSSEEIEKAFESLEISRTIRAEALTLEELYGLFHSFHK